MCMHRKSCSGFYSVFLPRCAVSNWLGDSRAKAVELEGRSPEKMRLLGLLASFIWEELLYFEHT